MSRPKKKEISLNKESVLSLMQEIYNELEGNCVYNLDTSQLFYDAMSQRENATLIMNGMKLVKENHTYINRITSLLSIL